MAVRLRDTDACGLGNVLVATTVAFMASTRLQTQQAKTVAGTYDALLESGRDRMLRLRTRWRLGRP
jgi:hypothetical protein